MIQIKDKADCCGCTACASICPKDAIIMEPDILGFKYPSVDLSKCIDCGLCEKVCAFNENYDKSLNLEEPEIYAARHKDIHEIETSRSGATFIAISDYIWKMAALCMASAIKIISEWHTNVQLLKKKEMSLKVLNMFRAIWTEFSDK